MRRWKESFDRPQLQHDDRPVEGLVVLLEDGTCSEVVNVEYRGQDTNTHDEARNYKYFKAEAEEYVQSWWTG